MPLFPTDRYLLLSVLFCISLVFFFFNDTPTTEIYTLSLHDALPIYGANLRAVAERIASAIGYDFRRGRLDVAYNAFCMNLSREDRKSTRLNSSHRCISYAVFCLKKKKKHLQ